MSQLTKTLSQYWIKIQGTLFRAIPAVAGMGIVHNYFHSLETIPPLEETV